jgi:hypothetical protein
MLRFVASVAFEDFSPNSESERLSSELVGTWSVSELTLNPDITWHGLA